MNPKRNAASRVAARWMSSFEHWPSYTTDLVLEGILGFYDATAERQYLDFVLQVWAFRGLPRDSLTIGNSYFTCLHAETCRRNGCPGTPPLQRREDYPRRGPQADDPHAVAAILMALAGEEP